MTTTTQTGQITTIPMGEIRTVRRGSMFCVHAYGVRIYAAVSGAGMLDGLYAWDADATSGIVGGIQHSGNFLHGTERRDPATSHGDWVKLPHLNGCHVVETQGLSYASNAFPGLAEVQDALAQRRVAGWECRNPVGGHNDEWIPLLPASDAAWEKFCTLSGEVL